MERNKLKVGFVGLGLMGNPMAQNIKKAGFPLAVFNRNTKKTEPLKKIGTIVCRTPKEVALHSDVVITMVTGPKDVNEVIFGKNGLIKGLKKGSVVIDMSTIGPQSAKKMAEKLAKFKLEFLDAPVTGSTIRAQSGELTIFVGGKKSVHEKCLPILKSMGKDVFYIGRTGQGQAIKLVNNLLVGSTLVALAEGMLLADAQGLSRKKVAEFLQNVPAVSGMMKLKLPNLLADKYPTAFSVANMSKDLFLAQREAKKGRKRLPMLDLAANLYQKAISKKLSDADNSAVIRVIK